MNILFFQDTLGVSGGEIWVADAATKLRERGHGVFIGCPSGSWLERQAEARLLPYFDYPIEEEFQGLLQWQLAELLEGEEIDLICCSIPGIRAEVPLLDVAVRETGRGAIVIRLGVPPAPGAIASGRLGVGFDTVRGIMAVSDYTRSQLLSANPDVDPDDVHIIYNGVDLQKFDPTAFESADRRQLAASLDIPDNHRIIGAVGRLDPVKNLPMLIETAGGILARFPDTTFLVVGDGIEREGLVGAAREAGVLDHFRFAGFVEDIPRLLHGIDILVHTARCEGLPNAVLEAMAMAKPVVSTAVGGVVELVEHGETGVLVPSDDREQLTRALGHLLEHPAETAEMGAAARRRAETEFDRRLQLDRLEGLFEALAEEGRRLPVRSPGHPVELHDLPLLYFERARAYRRVAS